VRQRFSGKNPPDLLVFRLWFSPPSEKKLQTLMHSEKILEILEKFSIIFDE